MRVNGGSETCNRDVEGISRDVMLQDMKIKVYPCKLGQQYEVVEEYEKQVHCERT